MKLDLVSILASSNDYDELTYVWEEWRRVASKPMRYILSTVHDLF